MNATYTLSSNKNIKDMASFICSYLSNDENMEAELIQPEGGGIFVQGRVRNGKYKQFIGMDRTIFVRFNPMDTTHVGVEIARGKWIDKSAVMAVSMFVLWPLTITSGIGMYRQARLAGKICEQIEAYLLQ